MCGRARCTLRPDDFPRACHLNGRRVRHVDMNRYRPSYNVSPGFNVPVVRREDDPNDDGAVLHCMKWGLVPSFTKKTEKPDHYKMFNARSESIKEKASFRRLVPKNRCLVAVEGFYEWKKDGSKKQPYYIHFKDARPLVFAALFDSWKNPEGEVLYTFTILTTSVSSSLEWLHGQQSGRFTVRSYYKYLNSTSTTSSNWPWKNIWKSKAPYKVKCFVWLAAREACLTQRNLQRKGIQLSNRCALCRDHEEDNNHLFLHCKVSSQLWYFILNLLGMKWCFPESTLLFLQGGTN